MSTTPTPAIYLLLALSKNNFYGYSLKMVLTSAGSFEMSSYSLELLKMGYSVRKSTIACPLIDFWGTKWISYGESSNEQWPLCQSAI